MSELVTLAQFQAQDLHYHIYRIRSTALDHQAHYHDYYQICYVVSGEILHLQGEEQVRLAAGDAFIVPPGFVHSLHFNNAYAEIYSLSFEEGLFPPGFAQTNTYRFLMSLLPEGSLSGLQAVRLRVPLDKDQRHLTEGLLSCLIHQYATPCQSGLSAAPGIVSALLCLLAQSYYSQPQNADRYESHMDYGGTILQCIEHIDRHYKEELSPGDLARRFGLSRSVLFAVFPQFAGMPLRKYIAAKRIKEAQVLIRSHPNRPLSQIAAEVGYKDDSTFYRNFLKITGMPPAKYKSLCASSRHE